MQRNDANLAGITAVPDVFLGVDAVYAGDARELLPCVAPDSIALAFWSPPYCVGKPYEKHLDFAAWRGLLETVIRLHFRLIKPGGFLAINIADVLCFRDPSLPRLQAEAVRRRRVAVTREDVLKAQAAHPNVGRRCLATLLGCSEQTVDRRLRGNNARGGKNTVQTRVQLVGGQLENWATQAGFYLYDRRIWVKDPAWDNSPWAAASYRSVDEFEYLYVFCRPGVVRYDRDRLSPAEWSAWGSRGVWTIPSVRANDDHAAKFPLELARRVIRLLTDPGDVVLDCFLGSGTTACAAVQAGRRYIGIELHPEYVRLARRNLAAASARLFPEP